MEMNQNSPRRKQAVKAPTDTGLRRRGQYQSNTEDFVFDIRTQEQGDPLLHVDINLPNKNVRVALFRDSDVDAVASSFVKKYQLEAGTEETLRNTLKEHMENALQEQ